MTKKVVLDIRLVHKSLSVSFPDSNILHTASGEVLHPKSALKKIVQSANKITNYILIWPLCSQLYNYKLGYKLLRFYDSYRTKTSLFLLDTNESTSIRSENGTGLDIKV